MFLGIFVTNHIAVDKELMDFFKTLYALPLLLGFGCLGYFMFKLWRENFEKEKIYFLGFVVLLFTIIYCVSFMGYDIQGVKQAQEAAEKSEKSAEKSEQAAKTAENSEQITRATIEIANLSNRAKWNNGGDFKSYKELVLLQEEIRNEGLKKFIIDEIKSIEISYDAKIIRPVADSLPFICQYSQPPCAKGFEPGEGFNAKNVYEHLSYQLWPERARAASLLRNLKTSPNKDDVNMYDLYEKLVSLMKTENEKSLFVNKLAFETYKDLTGFHPKLDGVFNFDAAIEDWEVRKKEFQIVEQRDRL